jgi:hypothetical protein
MFQRQTKTGLSNTTTKIIVDAEPVFFFCCQCVA